MQIFFAITEAPRSVCFVLSENRPDKMSDENFHLQWQDFEANTVSAFKSLFAEQDLLDVTLVSEDELVLEAHSLVLFTSSAFFRRVFS